MRSVTFKIYQEILNRDVYLTGYQTQETLKDVVLALTEYALFNFRSREFWPVADVKILVNGYLPKISLEEIVAWCTITRRVICEELGVADEGEVFLNLQVEGELILYEFLRLI